MCRNSGFRITGMMVSTAGIVALCCRNGGSQTPDRWLNGSRNTHGILAQGARFHLLGMPRNYALTLNMIMSNFVEVECGLISLSTVLAALEEAYEFDGKKELRDNILVIKRQIDSLQEELSEYITKLDTYIISE